MISIATYPRRNLRALVLLARKHYSVASVTSAATTCAFSRHKITKRYLLYELAATDFVA